MSQENVEIVRPYLRWALIGATSSGSSSRDGRCRKRQSLRGSDPGRPSLPSRARGVLRNVRVLTRATGRASQVLDVRDTVSPPTTSCSDHTSGRGKQSEVEVQEDSHTGPA